MEKNYFKTFFKLPRSQLPKFFLTFLKIGFKVEKILKGSLDSIDSPSVKFQIMGGKVCFRWKVKTLLDVINTLLKTKTSLTLFKNVLPYFLK